VQFTDDELEMLRGIMCAWIDEGFTRPPYDPEVYALIEKLGITQDNVTQYNLTPPPQDDSSTPLPWRATPSRALRS
jgi:hypothetical protein